MAVSDPPTVETEVPPEPLTPPGDDPGAQGWRLDKQNRWWAPAHGRSGKVYRRGNETLDEAHARDAKGPKDHGPKAKPKIPKAPAPTQISLKELEFALTEALSAPAFIAGAQGDAWAANHFTESAPVLARNLTKAAEHNPWLRAKLEASMAGDLFMMRILTLMPVAAGLIGYALPPIIYYFEPKIIPDEAREMFKVPYREKKRDRKEPDGAAPPAHAEADDAPAPVAAAA